MLIGSVLSKSVNTKDSLFILGGPSRGLDHCQRYDKLNKKWNLEKISLIKFSSFGVVENWLAASFSQEPTIVHYKEEEIEVGIEEDVKDSNFVFGTDDEPYILQINRKNEEVKILSCPLQLILKNFQGACRISDTEVLLAGGINHRMSKITTNVFKIDLVTQQVEQLKEMNNDRYTFPMIKIGVNFFAYPSLEYMLSEGAPTELPSQLSLELVSILILKRKYGVISRAYSIQDAHLRFLCIKRRCMLPEVLLRLTKEQI